MNRFTSYYCCLTLLIPFLIQAQSSEQIRDLYFEGNQYILSEEYIEALPAFIELYELNPTANIRYKLGECYLNIEGSEENAIPFLEQAVTSSSADYDAASPAEKNAPLRAWFLLGRAYRVNNRLEKAIESFKILQDSLTGGDKEVTEQLDREIELCRNAALFMESPITFEASNLGSAINNSNNNYHPLVIDDAQIIYYMEALKFYDAVMKGTKSGGDWSDSENITMKLRSDGDFFLTSVSSTGDLLFFQFYDVYTNGDIYFSAQKDNDWSKIRKLNDNINTPYNETHASVSPDGKSLFFTSNRPGGYGGLDIYWSKLQDDGEWGPAENLGPVINTFRNETTPFYTKSGMLYFSSESHFNMGGYDVFKSAGKIGGEWGKPKNLGYPVNTTSDDVYFFPFNTGEIAYFAVHNQEGFGKRDIYRFTNMSEPRLRKFELTGTVNLPEKEEPASDAEVILNQNDRIIDRAHVENDSFYFRTYEGIYDVIVQAEGYLADTTRVNLLDDQDQWEIPVLLELVRVEEEEVIQASDTIILRNFYFRFDQTALTSSEKEYIDSLVSDLIVFDSLEIVLHGHTDSLGPVAYNTYLAKARANAVKEVFVDSGFGEARITVDPVGEQEPLMPNTLKSGRDFVEGRKYNRRVEIELRNIPEKLIIISDPGIPDSLKSYLLPRN